MRMPNARPIPVTVLSGYLGSGKTTVVNHVLRHADGLRIAVLVNDFGTLPIDADLIEANDGPVLSIAGGCVCCSYGDDLIAALASLGTRTPVPDTILIETSGVALPGAIARTLQLLPGVALDAVVVLADAETVRTRAADRYMGDTITRQLADADLLILTKSDLISVTALETTRAWLAVQCPGTPLLTAAHGAIALDVIFAAGQSQADAAGADRPAERAAIRPVATHTASRLPPIRPHLTSEIDAAEFVIEHAVDGRALASALSDPALGLVRVKGFVRDQAGTWQTLQVVGARWTLERAPVGIAPPGRLVCISHGRPVPRAEIAAMVAAPSVRPAP
jgi:G3E family GTPase